jgi:hypothetical protein
MSVWLIVLVGAAVFFATSAAGGRGRRGRVILACMLMAVALGVFARAWRRASQTQHTVEILYADKHPDVPAAVVRLDQGEIEICADFLDQLLTKEVRVASSAADSETEADVSAVAVAGEAPPPPAPATAEAVEDHIEELIRAPGMRTQRYDLFRNLLRDLQGPERRDLAIQIAERHIELAKAHATGAASRATASSEYKLRLNQEPGRLNQLAQSLSVTPPSEAPGLFLRIFMLIGTIAVAALVLRASTRHAHAAAERSMQGDSAHPEHRE